MPVDERGRGRVSPLVLSEQDPSSLFLLFRRRPPSSAPPHTRAVSMTSTKQQHYAEWNKSASAGAVVSSGGSLNRLTATAATKGKKERKQKKKSSAGVLFFVFAVSYCLCLAQPVALTCSRRADEKSRVFIRFSVRQMPKKKELRERASARASVCQRSQKGMGQSTTKGTVNSSGVLYFNRMQQGKRRKLPHFFLLRRISPSLFLSSFFNFFFSGSH